MRCRGLQGRIVSITPEELCNRFKADPNRVKKLWAELTVKNEKAADAK